MSELLEQENNTTRPKPKSHFFEQYEPAETTASELAASVWTRRVRKPVFWGGGDFEILPHSYALTTFVDAPLHIPETQDQELIAWLDEAKAEYLRAVQAAYAPSQTSNYRNYLVHSMTAGWNVPTSNTVLFENWSLDLKSLAQRVASATAHSIFSVIALGDDWERPISELVELKDGWNGADTIAPTTKTKDEVQLVIGLVRFNQRLPEFVVDDSDGAVSLTWSRDGDPAFLSLVFRGDGRVTIVGRSSERGHVISETVDIKNEAKVLAPFTADSLAHLTSKD